MSGGQLILAATPLGNILDASPRLKETLEQADLIAAEDTRRAKRLFADLNLEIKAPVISLFEENEIEKIPDIIEKLKSGLKVVVISDAGTPAISDPGYRLVTKAIEENISITVIPGPSAVLSALVLSGLPTDRFSFETLSTRFREMAFLNKGLILTLTDERAGHVDEKGNPLHVRYEYADGIIDFVKHLNITKGATHKSIISFATEEMKQKMSLEVAMQWNTGFSESPYILKEQWYIISYSRPNFP